MLENKHAAPVTTFDKLIKIETLNDTSYATMGDICQLCNDPAFDDCVSCNKPTCKKHGKLVGDHFVCKKCADKFR